tara:strand:+ start:438 stop:620 length:183 start_codon:yes stop_codon:yes gene_type:complete
MNTNNPYKGKQGNYTYGQLKQFAEATETKLLKFYIKDVSANDWNILHSVANDEIIKRGEK